MLFVSKKIRKATTESDHYLAQVFTGVLAGHPNL